jgi:hypothetical protein
MAGRHYNNLTSDSLILELGVRSDFEGWERLCDEGRLTASDQGMPRLTNQTLARNFKAAPPKFEPANFLTITKSYPRSNVHLTATAKMGLAAPKKYDTY